MDIPADVVKKRNDVKQRLYYMFKGKVDLEIVDLVLAECKYEEDAAVSNLLQMAGEDVFPWTLSENTTKTTTPKLVQAIPIATSMKSPTNMFEQILAPSPPVSQISKLMMSPPKVSQISQLMTSPPKVNRNTDNIDLFSTSNSNYNAAMTNSELIQMTSSKSNIDRGDVLCNSVPQANILFPHDKSIGPSTSVHRNIDSSRENNLTKTSNLTSTSDQLKNEEKLKSFINHPSRKVLVIMRGLPGSGKSYRAGKLNGASGVIYSTDDFFHLNRRYEYDVRLLSEAHNWNQQRAFKAIRDKISPIFIDNTNLKIWEMKPYVAEGARNGYYIKILEAETPWAWQASVLARRNKHNVPKDKLIRMMENYEKVMSINDIFQMNNKPGRATSDQHTRTSSDQHHRSSTVPRTNILRTPDRSPVSIKKLNHQNNKALPTGIVNHSGNEETDFIVSSSPHNTEKNKTPVRAKTHLDIEQRIINDAKNKYTPLKEPHINRRNTSENISSPSYIPLLTTSFTNFEAPSNIINTVDTISVNPLHTASLVTTSNNSFLIGEQSTNQISTTLKPTSLFSSTYNAISAKQMSSAISPAIMGAASTNQDSSSAKTTMIGSNYFNEKTISSPRASSFPASVNTPTKARDSLDSVINTSSNVSKISLISDDSVEEVASKTSTSSNEQMESNLQFLYECFPDYTKIYCKKWLKRYNGDLVKTCDYLSRLSQVDDLPEDATEVITVDEDDDVIQDIDMSSPKRIDTPPLGEMFFCDSKENDMLSIALDKRLGMELIQKYSTDISIESLSNDDLVVDMDIDFGRQLFYMWKSSIKARKRKAQTTLDDDVRYAQELQKQADQEALLLDSPDGKKKKKKAKALALSTNYNKNKPSSLFSPNAWSPSPQSSPQTKIKDASGQVLTPKRLQIRDRIYQSYPGVDEDALDDVLQATNYNLEIATALIQRSCGINEIAQIQSTSNWENVNSPPKKKQTIESIAGPSGMNTLDAIPVDPGNEDYLYQTMTEENQDYADYRAEANLQANLRAECFQKAAKANEQKQGEVAQFYAQKAQQHTLKMKEAHTRAAEIILLKKNKAYMGDQQTIDLHGLHVDESLRALKNFIDNAFNVGHSQINVITGRGNHSKGGHSKVQMAVRHLLKQRNFIFETTNGGGMFKVHLRRC